MVKKSPNLSLKLGNIAYTVQAIPAIAGIVAPDKESKGLIV